MQNNKVLKLESNPTGKPFITIDDVVEVVPQLEELLEKLAVMLKELGGRKHPLAVRKGKFVNATKSKRREPIKGSSSTYFLDVRKAKTGSKYLRITQKVHLKTKKPLK